MLTVEALFSGPNLALMLFISWEPQSDTGGSLILLHHNHDRFKQLGLLIDQMKRQAQCEKYTTMLGPIMDAERKND